MDVMMLLTIECMIGPMHTLATQYDLPIHEIDTFTGWNVSCSDIFLWILC